MNDFMADGNKVLTQGRYSLFTNLSDEYDQPCCNLVLFKATTTMRVTKREDEKLCENNHGWHIIYCYGLLCIFCEHSDRFKLVNQ